MDTKEHILRVHRQMSLWIVAILTLTGLLLIQLQILSHTLYLLLFCSVYTFATSVSYGICWKQIAVKSPTAISGFYIAASTIRMLLGIIVILIATAFLYKDKPAFTEFVLIFVGFYLSLMIFDSIFFAHVEKSQAIK